MNQTMHNIYALHRSKLNYVLRNMGEIYRYIYMCVLKYEFRSQLVGYTGFLCMSLWCCVLESSFIAK